jgi:hypothetical protein
LKNKCSNYEPMSNKAGQARTEDSKRSNAHWFNVQPVFRKCNVGCRLFLS